MPRPRRAASRYRKLWWPKRGEDGRPDRRLTAGPRHPLPFGVFFSAFLLFNVLVVFSFLVFSGWVSM